MTTVLLRCTGWLILVLLAIRPSLDVLTGLRIGALGINPAAATGLLMIAAGTIWFLLLSPDDRKRLLRFLPLQVWALFLLAMLPWAVGPIVAAEHNRLAGLREWIRLLSILPVAAFAVHAAMKQKAARVIGALLVSLVVPAIVGMYQVLFGEGQQVLGIHRIQGTFVHPNPYAFYLVTMLVVMYAGGRQSSHPLRWAIGGCVVLGLLVATFSFTGAGMFGVAACVLLAGESPRMRWGAALGLLLFVAVFLATDAGRERVRDLARWDNLDEIEATGRETPSHVWRVLNWRFLLRQWDERPLLGYGLSSIPRINPNRNQYAGGVGHDAHNDYIRFLVETGAVGVLIWLSALGTWTVVLFRGVRKARAGDRLIPLAGLALLMAWLAGSANDNLIQATAYQYTLWAALGIAFAVLHTECHPEKDENRVCG